MSGEMVSGKDDSFEKELKVKKYGFLLELSFNEDRLIGERSRYFLIANGLLLTAFGLAKTPLFWIVLLSVGSALGYFWIEVGRRNIIALQYWWSRLYLLEADKDISENLQIYTERAHYYGGEPPHFPKGKFPSGCCLNPWGRKDFLAISRGLG